MAEGEMSRALVGAVLNSSYRIDGLLGEGGMGAVYYGTHLRLDKPVAVKVMARELSANAEALARFQREALVTSNLGHPNIVQVFDFSTTPTGEPFLVMEFLEGQDLDHRLRRDGRLARDATLHIVKQVAAAVTATHAKGIIHRDLKPGNIYLLKAAGAPDFVKVLDFGISKVRSATVKITRTTAILGTPGYMSPEQARGNADEIDERTDQWALACIAWECLCGEVPFGGENMPSILFKIVHEPPPPLLPRVPGLHPQVEEVLLHALAKSKHDRFADVNDFAVALEAALTGEATKVVPRVPKTVQVPQTTLDVGGSKPLVHSTTFSQTSGESHDDDRRAGMRSKTWTLAFALIGMALLLGGVLILFRARSKPVSAPLETESPSPAAPVSAVVPRLVPPKAPPPAPPTERALPAPSAAIVDEPSVPVVSGKGKQTGKKGLPKRAVPKEGEAKSSPRPASRDRSGRSMVEDL